MPIKIEGPTNLAKLMEKVIEEGKKKKLTVPFLADGFKSEKTPMQPDGVTPIVIEKADISSEIEIEATSKAKYTQAQLFKMTKDEQTKLLKEAGIKPIPKTEKERVEMLLSIFS